jgi:hypothetical protein
MKMSRGKREKRDEKILFVPPETLERLAGSDCGAPGSATGGIEASGTPGGGTEIGGLAGTNIGAGAPINTDLDRAMETDFPQNKDLEEDDAEREIPFADVPTYDQGVARTTLPDVPPGTSHRGDSTIGSDPNPATSRRHRRKRR